MREKCVLPVLLAASFAVSQPALGAGLDLVFDTSAARATLDVLTGAVPATPEELARVAALPANQAQIRHAAGFRASFTTESFIEALGKAETGGVLRIGLVHYNTAAEVDRALAGVEGIAAGAR